MGQAIRAVSRTPAGGRPPTGADEGISKRFGAMVALRDISFTVGEGEFVCFLGPSGCGKTTLLRIVAGLERQNVGVVRMRGQDVSALPPSRRNYGIVFQSYALFPNLTVARNIAYGLRARRSERPRIDARVDELLELIHLPRHKQRYPAQLSGGEQQRVALARALAPAPSLLLLDEPLSALDARVRLALRQEMKDLQKRLGITTIMVTHDQEEALTMADRIVVMNHGVVEQIGTPGEIYGAPASLFVARFVGHMNFLSAVADGQPGQARLGPITLRHRLSPVASPGAKLTLGIRPEEIRIGPAAHGAENRLGARVIRIQFQGALTRLALTAGEAAAEIALECDLPAATLAELGLKEGSDVPLALPADAMRVFIEPPSGA